MVIEEEEEEVGDWSNVPYHMVELIMNKLMTPEISDYIRCGALCTSWRTTFIHHHHHPPPRPRPITQPPLLIVPAPSSSSSFSSNTSVTSSNKKKKRKRAVTNNTKSLSFYNIIHKKLYNEFQLTIPSNRHFRGSSHGWLVAVDEDNDDCQIQLFNPFLSPSVVPYSSSSSSVMNGNNKFEILLPSLKDLSIVINKTIVDDIPNDGCVHRSTSSYAYLRKVVLSADPLSNPIDYIVMAILGFPAKLAYCRPGSRDNKAWTLVEFEYMKYIGFKDVMYYKGNFFALHWPGTVVVLDPTQNMAVTLKIPCKLRSRIFSSADTMYLVESAGSLLQVHRELEVEDVDTVIKRHLYSTTRFLVLKLVDETKKEKRPNWKLLKNLGGRTLFLGDNHSMSIRASHYPGCKPNSIYFTDDFMAMYHCIPWNGPHDLGVFNLENGTIENHYPTNHNTLIWPVPIWIQPTILAPRTDLDDRF